MSLVLSRIAIASAATAAFVLPSSATAATVQATRGPTCPKCDGVPWTLTFTAEPGEANRVQTSRTPDGAIRFAEPIAPITTSAPCAQVDANTVECPSGPVAIYTGDGDDRLGSLVATWVLNLGPGDDHFDEAGREWVDVLDAGPGDDELHAGFLGLGRRWNGGDGADLITGSPADDILSGGAGSDVLFGGPGQDVISAADTDTGAGAPAADDVDGGDGLDLVSYAGRQGPVTVDLADPSPDGGAGEGDRLISIEAVLGGSGSDLLSGDDGENVLQGGPGNDRLDGRGGADHLLGGRGSDRFFAGAGNDVIDAAGTAGDFAHTGFNDGPDTQPEARFEPVDCGDGDDDVHVNADLVAENCESDVGTVPFHPVSVTSRTLTFRFVCPQRRRFARSCIGRITLSASGTRMISQRFELPRHSGLVRVRRPAGAGGTLTVTTSVSKAGPLARYAIRLGPAT